MAPKSRNTHNGICLTLGIHCGSGLIFFYAPGSHAAPPRPRTSEWPKRRKVWARR